jgi:hypothetical protein
MKNLIACINKFLPTDENQNLEVFMGSIGSPALRKQGPWLEIGHSTIECSRSFYNCIAVRLLPLARRKIEFFFAFEKQGK